MTNNKGQYIFFGVLLILLGITPLLNAGFDNDIVNWLLLVAFPVLLISIFINRPSFSINLRDPEPYLLLFMIWAALSFFWSISQLRTTIEFIQLLLFILAFFIMRSLDDELKVKALKIGSVAAVAIALYGILEYVFLNVSVKSTTPIASG